MSINALFIYSFNDTFEYLIQYFYKYLDTSKNAKLFTFKKNIFGPKRAKKSIAKEKTVEKNSK